MSQEAESRRVEESVPDKPSLNAFTPTQPVDQDPAEIQRMQEEEFERRLKGEYIAAQQRLSSVVSFPPCSVQDQAELQIHDNMDRPLRLSSIRLHPAPPTTRSSFLNSLLSPFLSPSSLPQWLNPAPPPPKTLHEVLLSTRALVAHLDKFGVFDLDQSSVRLENKRGGDADEVELVLGLKERGRLFLKAGTEVGGGEGGGVSCYLPMGGAELTAEHYC
jgi:outer membrane protein insertion porin family